MKITVTQLVKAMEDAGMQVQWFPQNGLRQESERWPVTMGSADLRKIAEAVNLIPTVAAAPEIETCDAVGIKTDGTEVHLGPIPLPATMKIKEIARSMWGGDPDDDMSEAALGVGAMEELMNWLKEQGRLK